MRTNTKKLLSVLLVIAMALSLLPSSMLRASAQQQTQTKLEDTDGLAYCEHCKKTTQWTPYDKATHGVSGLGGSKHLYLTQDTTLTEGGAIISYGSICFHLNGCNLTSTDTSDAALFQGTVNVMGDGIVTCPPKDAVFHVNYANAAATANIYGGTYRRDSSVPIVRIWGNGGTVNFHGGTIDAADGRYEHAVELWGSDGRLATFNMRGGQILTTSKCDAVYIQSAYGSLHVTGGKIDGHISGVTDNVVTGFGYRKQMVGTKAMVVMDVAAIVISGGTTIGSYTTVAEAIEKAGTGDTVRLEKAVTANEFVRLTKDLSIDLGDQDALYVDLNGHKLNLTGSGKVYAIDTANDSYELTDGAVTAPNTIAVQMDVTADGKRYIGLTEADGSISFHRLVTGVGYVTLRTSEAGLYFKAKYECDTDLLNAVQTYGVVISLNDMPGADFDSESDTNMATTYYTAEKPLVSGQVVTSGSVFGIMKTSRTSRVNAWYGEMKIYVNPYLTLAGGRMIMCDTENVGKTAEDAGFDGIAYSLYDAVKALETKWYDTSVATDDVKSLINDFYNEWASHGMDVWADDLPNIVSGGTTDAPNLQVGYAKVNMTPDFSVGLSGYSNESTRRSTGVMSDVFVTCIAAVEGGERVLLYTIDMCGLYEDDWNVLRSVISPATGVPKERILIAATHTHSGPAMTRDANGQKFTAMFKEKVVEAAKTALADRAPASIETATGEIDGMCFIRRYLMKDGTHNGSESASSNIVGHAYETDKEMVLVKFNRGGGEKKDVVMVNWQGHPDHSSQFGGTLISSDYIGCLRDELERLSGANVAYFTAADGDVGTLSLINEEKHGLAWDEYGTKLGQYAYEILQTCQPLEGEGIAFTTGKFPAEINHTMDHMLEQAKEIVALRNTDSAAANALAKEYGLSGTLEALMIVSRAGKGATENRETSVLRIGGLGLISANYEMSSINGMDIKENSPFETTFIMTGNHGYIPYTGAYDYGDYEANSSLFTRGTAEALAEEFIRLLNTLK